MATISLKPIDRLEILSVMDNSVDVLMSSTPVAQRAPRSLDSLSRPQLRAEHGVSMLVTVRSGGHEDSFLFDTGVSADGALHNMDVLEVRPNQLHAVVLSHGHTDHTNGLSGMMQRYGRARLPVMLHPEAFLQLTFNYLSVVLSGVSYWRLQLMAIWTELLLFKDQ